MKKKPNFGALAKTAASTRAATQTPAKPERHHTQPSRSGTAPITLHFPKEVRNQLKLLAVKQETTVLNLAAEGFNAVFAKYGLPEIAPTDNNN